MGGRCGEGGGGKEVREAALAECILFLNEGVDGSALRARHAASS